MTMEAGNVTADLGMSQGIYAQLDKLLSPPLVKAVEDAAGNAEMEKLAKEVLKGAREGWQKMAFAIAHGVVEHLKHNMDIVGIQTTGDVSASVSGPTDPAPPGPHLHTVNLTASQTAVTFHQSGAASGHVE